MSDKHTTWHNIQLISGQTLRYSPTQILLILNEDETIDIIASMQENFLYQSPDTLSIPKNIIDITNPHKNLIQINDNNQHLLTWNLESFICEGEVKIKQPMTAQYQRCITTKATSNNSAYTPNMPPF